MLKDTGNTAMQNDFKDILDEKKIAELATSKDAQEAFFGKDGLIVYSGPNRTPIPVLVER